MPTSSPATFSLAVNPAPVTSGRSWQFILATPQPDGTYLAEITQSQTRTITFRTAATFYSEATVDILGTDAAAVFITELQTDLQVLYNGQILFCGRFGATADQLDASTHRFQPTAVDYREVLRRRSFAEGHGPHFVNNDISDIAWGLIRPDLGPDGIHTGVQGYPGGNLGIARGAGKGGIGYSQTVNYIRQQFAGQEIDNLAQATLSPAASGTGPGQFEWDVTPYAQNDLRLDIWAPQRGTSHGVVLEYGGGLVSSIQRTTDPSAFANSVFVTGSNTNASTTVESNSNGGTISNIGSWSSPSNGTLTVASTGGFTPFGGTSSDPGGGLTVHASGNTNALLTYTGTTSNTFTGCQYVSGSGSGTVSTGNSVTQTPLDSIQLDASDITTRPEGRWDQVIGTNYQQQGPLTTAAGYYLADAEVVTPSYQIQLYPGVWQGPGHIWLGDTVTVRIDSGRLQVNDQLRVQEMDFSISVDDIETLVLTVGRIPFDIKQQVPRMLRRLRSLESE